VTRSAAKLRSDIPCTLVGTLTDRTVYSTGVLT
jgi:hypothetical protein